MATIELTQDNFEVTINGNDMVIVDFWAPWCAPCRSFAPTFEAASDQHADIVFAKVNTEEQQQLAAAFGIRSIPTLMVFREQIILYSEAGALPASALEHLISQVRALDMADVRRELASQGGAS
jgi:thioredoxin 1